MNISYKTALLTLALTLALATPLTTSAGRYVCVDKQGTPIPCPPPDAEKKAKPDKPPVTFGVEDTPAGKPFNGGNTQTNPAKKG
ncbi:MAG: hypothetical protein V6Z89_02495 [Desulfobacter sp.]